MAQGLGTPLRYVVNAGKNVQELGQMLASILGTVYYVDPTNGSSTGDGRSPDTALDTILAAYNLCVAGKHDVVAFIASGTAVAPTAALTWSKDFTHLIGIGQGALHGEGQYSWVEAGASDDITPIFTFSGKGCVIANIKIINFHDAAADSGAVVVSGESNHFVNCMIAGMASTAAGARAGSYSLTVSGEQNLFERCAIGLDTILRAAANSELILASGATRNTFLKCRFESYCETAGKFLVNVANGVDRWNEFEDCIFQNFWVNWGGNLTDAFNMDASATHQIVLRGLNQLVGVTGWADTVTRLYSAAPQSHAGFGVEVNPTT